MLRKNVLRIGITFLLLMNFWFFYQPLKNTMAKDTEGLSNTPSGIADLIHQSKTKAKQPIFLNLILISGLAVFYYSTKPKADSRD